MSLSRLLPVRLAGGFFVLLVLLGAGWWFFIRESNEVQESTSDVTDAVRTAAAATPTTKPASTQPAASATASGSGTSAAAASSIGSQSYKIVAGQSLAWYLAPEKLASLPTSSVAKGTTSEVSGEFHFTAEGLDPAKTTTFTVGLTKLKSDESRRDSRAQDALQTSRYPTATFTATKLTGMPAQFGATDSVMQLTGTFDLHGVKKEVTWELKVKKDGEILSGLATLKFKYTDFGITKPDIGGFVTVESEVTIQVQIFAAPA
ncbi:MAG: YceI family protein [Chloroflexi bacterium]|nr:YceI family protein [Chloroflexota bacterium]